MGRKPDIVPRVIADFKRESMTPDQADDWRALWLMLLGADDDGAGSQEETALAKQSSKSRVERES